MGVRIERVEWADPRAAALRAELNSEMQRVYTGRHDDDPDFPAKAAVAFAVHPETVVAVLLALDGVAPVGHAALRRPVDAAAARDAFELKNVVVTASARGRGVARALLAAADEVARELGARRIVLQTGDRQPEAEALYERVGYRAAPVFDPYRPITNSRCFAKAL